MSAMQIEFPAYSGLRCLMMPYIQGDPSSVPDIYAPYFDIIASVFLDKGDMGFLTIDESTAERGKPHRGKRAKFARALHTEAGIYPACPPFYCWGGGWGGKVNVRLDWDTRILLANSIDDTCAVWGTDCEDTTDDGDIGHLAEDYPYESAVFMRAGQVCEIGILTPHESLPVPHDMERQFIRIVSSGVHGREDYFTCNSKLEGLSK